MSRPPIHRTTLQTIHHALIDAYKKDTREIAEYFASNPTADKFKKAKDGVSAPTCSVIKDPVTGRLLLLANENLASPEIEKSGKRLLGKKKYGDTGVGVHPVKYALDIEAQQLCVVKKITGRERKAAFEKEQRIAHAMGITQPGFDTLLTRGDPNVRVKYYMVQQYLGTTLKDIIESERTFSISHSEILEIFISIFLKIQALHNHGYTHGDLHSGNITVLFDSTGHLVDTH